MKDTQQRAAAKAFAERWNNRGYEKGESQPFWIDLLEHVLCVENGASFIEFEDQVHLDHTSFIDGYIPSTKVLIEQKGLGKNLMKPIPQSDGSVLTPFQQAKRYITELPLSKHPRWVVTCNFESFYVYDMEKPGGEPEQILLKNLEKEYYRLQFLADSGNENLKREMEISIAAGDLVGLLYDALLKQYKDPTNPTSLKSLNMLCVRLVFCLYAEDAGIFGKHTMFHDYMSQYEAKDWREKLIQFFSVLDQKEEDRDPYLNDDLKAFPYVNGGLFSDEKIEIPNITDEIRDIVLSKASEDFDWSEISPTIFGAVFESTLNPETRRNGGMHYTSVENIHKVIDPLFLDDLKREFEEVKNISVTKTRKSKLLSLQEKIASLRFLDPACGSGNFLTETYLSLRSIENKIINEINDGQMVFGEIKNPIKCSISQLYGIEINDFAVTVAKTALWIAESQMMKKTENLLHMQLEFLPLKTNATIVEGNALRMDWAYLHEDKSNAAIRAKKVNVISPNDPRLDELKVSYVMDNTVPYGKEYDELNVISSDLHIGIQETNTCQPIQFDYIMGNPPFVGTNWMSDEQRNDMDFIWSDTKRGKLDYVSCWYVKAADYINGNDKTRCAFVSTNSICQGEQAVSLWKRILVDEGFEIDFGVKSFVWNSESTNKASVHVVIVGISKRKNNHKYLYDEKGARSVDNINGYLLPAPTVIIEERSIPLYDVPPIVRGSQATDNGYYLFDKKEHDEFIKAEPQSAKYFKRFMMGKEFLNNIERWCLWIPEVTPNELKKSPMVVERIKQVKKYREQSKNIQTQKTALTPQIFGQYRPPASQYIAFAKVSSERRRYIPMGFLTDDVIPGDKLFTIPDADLYMFGVLMSNVHNAWMRTTCGRLKSDYSYSTTIVYNNFPWCDPTEEYRRKIEETAQKILDVRNKYTDSSLADLYDDTLMPPELRKAHNENDKAVLQAYGFRKGSPEYSSESACVAALMKLYQKKVSEIGKE